MKSKFFGRFAKMAVAILAVGLSLTSCYDEEVGGVQVIVPEPTPETASYVLYGTVTNSTTFAAVAGATVEIGSSKATTNEVGYYEIKTTSPLNGTATYEAEGYTKATKEIKMEAIVSGTSKLRMDVALAEASHHGGDEHDHGNGGNNAGGGSAE